MEVEQVDVGLLDTAQRQAWLDFQRLYAGQGGPFQSASFAKLTAQSRGDVMCLMFHTAGEIAGFLAVQKPSRFLALPVGAPINDLHGIVGDPALRGDGPVMCRTLKVGRMDFSHAMEEQGLLRAGAKGAGLSWYTDLSPGRDNFMAALKERRPKFVYHIGRQGRQMARDHGEILFTAGSPTREHLDQLFRWKLTKLRSTGQPAVWSTPWLRRLITDTFTTDDADLAGILFTLTVGDRLLAANYCLRGPRALQGLVMSHDPAFEHYSPGKQLGLKVVEWAAQAGLDEMLFGPGESLFKRQLGTHQKSLTWGYISQPSWSGRLRSTQYFLRSQIERAPIPWIASLPGRAMRRLDLHLALKAPRAPAFLPTVAETVHRPVSTSPQ